MQTKFIIGFLIATLLIAAFSCSPGKKKEADKKEESSLARGVAAVVVGKVYQKIGKKSIPLKTKDQILEGALLQTEARSYTDILFADISVRILPSSLIQVNELRRNSGKIQQAMTVHSGGGFFRVLKKLTKEESFIVRTPNVVAAVRGTDYMVQHQNNSSTIAVDSGQVEVKKPDQADGTLVTAGKQASLDQSGQLKIADLQKQNLENIASIKQNMAKYSQEILDIIRQKMEEIPKQVEELKNKNREAVDELKKKLDAGQGTLKEGNQENIDKTKKGATDYMEELKKKNQEHRDKQVNPQQ